MRKFATSLIIAALSVVAVSARDKAADYKLNVQNFCELTVVDGVGVDYVCLPDSARLGRVQLSARHGGPYHVREQGRAPYRKD